MPITNEDDYVIKVKNPEGKYRIVGGIVMGDYGPRISLINCPLLREALSKAEEGRRIYLPMYQVEKPTETKETE